MSPISRARLPIACLAALLGSAFLASSAAAQGSHDGAPVSVTGVLELLTEDDFDHDRADTFFVLRERRSKKRFKLRFRQLPPGHLRHGQHVSVHGRAHGHRIEVDQVVSAPDAASSSQPTSSALEGAALDERRALVLMVDLEDAKASSRYSLDQIADVMFSGARAVDGLYLESSHLQTGFPGDTDGDGLADVFGPFSVPYSGNSCGFLDYSAWADAADAAASASGIDLSLYQHRVYVVPHYSETACSWAGLAWVTCGDNCRAWVAQGDAPMVYAHELGHNRGMQHAGIDWNNDGSIDSEYGDSSDPMGSSLSWHGFNAPHTDQMGWLAGHPGSSVTVTADGVYDVYPLNLDPALAGGPQILKIEKPDSNEFYYLSFRQPIGYDDGLISSYTRGVNIHRFWGGAALTLFIESLVDDGQFLDPVNDVSVTQLGRGAGDAYVTVQVSLGGGASACIPTSPSVTISPASQATAGGETLLYAVDVTNQDPAACEASSFDLASAFPPELTGALASSSLLLDPGASGSTSLQVTAGGADGSHGFSVTASGPLTSGSGSAAVVVDGTPPSAPELHAKLRRRIEVHLAWDGASDGSGSGVAFYRNHREGGGGGPLEVEVVGDRYTDLNTSARTRYVYTLRAVDAAGNLSAPSNPLTVTTKKSGH